MSYVSELRKKIGHDEHIGVCAGVLLHRAGKVLLQKRRDNGCWAMHAGGLELGETVEDAARRELREETGLTAHRLTLLGVFSGERLRFTYPNGDKVCLVSIVYACDDFSGSIKPQTAEVSELQWFDVHALPENISQPERPAMEAFRAFMAAREAESERKLAVLARVGQRLNDAGVVWAVGASLMLYLNGMTDAFHDIDVMTTLRDAPKVKRILQEMGTLAPPNPNPQYKTKHFYEFTIDGVELDVIAGFIITQGGVDHDCALDIETITTSAQVGGVRIPLQSADAWRRYYALMGREDKARLIDWAG